MMRQKLGAQFSVQTHFRFKIVEVTPPVEQELETSN
jgi:hypothetical protein